MPRHRLRTFGAFAVSAILAIGLTSCAASSDPSSTSDVLKTNIATDTQILVPVADAHGDFEAQGVDAEPVLFQSGLEGVQALASKQVDFGFVFSFATINSLSDDLVVLGAVDNVAPGFQRMFFGAGISEPSELAGQKIGVLAGTAQQYLTELWLDREGLTGQVEEVPLPGVFEMLAALQTGDIQAAFITNAGGAAQAEADPNLTYFGDDSGLQPATGVYMVTRRDVVTEKPELVDRVLRALDSATDFIIADPAAAAQMGADFNKGDADVIAESLAANEPGLGLSEAQFQELTDVQNYLIAAGKKPAGTDFTQFLDLEPMKQVVGADKVYQP